MRRPSAASVRIGGLALMLGLLTAAGPSPIWQVTVTQFDKAGTLAEAAQTMACPETGCQQRITLDVLGKKRGFLMTVTMIPRGGYVVLQAQEPEIGKVVEFEKGFVGPIFVPVHSGVPTTTTLRFTLTGKAASGDPEQELLMRDVTRSLVFHRKMEPDLLLRVELVPPPA